MENNKFLRIGNRVSFSKVKGNVKYQLENNVVYGACYDHYDEEVYLTIKKDFKTPKKLYITDKDNRFVEKVLNTYRQEENKTVGVLLTGEKGSGKTVTTKLISTKANLPIISIDRSFGLSNLSKLIDELGDTSACILFDEIDKFDDCGANRYAYLLSVLDGIDTTNKHLFIFTANQSDNVTEFIKDRCSRIRYWKKFNTLDKDFIKLIVEDKIKNEIKAESVTQYIIDHMRIPSIDNIVTYVDEIVKYPDDTIEELFEDMNLSEK